MPSQSITFHLGQIIKTTMENYIDFLIGIELKESARPYFTIGSTKAMDFLTKHNIYIIPGQRVYTPHHVKNNGILERWSINKIKDICQKEGFELNDFTEEDQKKIHTRIEIAENLCKIVNEKFDGENKALWLYIVNSAEWWYANLKEKKFNDVTTIDDLAVKMEFDYDELHDHMEDSYHYSLDNIGGEDWCKCAKYFLKIK